MRILQIEQSDISGGAAIAAHQLPNTYRKLLPLAAT